MSVITSPESLEKCVLEMGFLPFFSNEIPGFSIEEQTPAQFWFNGDIDGPWEWKGPVITGGMCAYGKFFRRKAGYVSLEWLPDFINMRREHYHPTPAEQQIYHTLVDNESLLSKELKRLCGYVAPRAPRRTRLDKAVQEAAHLDIRKPKSHRQTFETAITNLQMATYVVIADFEYLQDRLGRPYGWGVARYCTPEAFYETDFHAAVQGRTPEASAARIIGHLHELFPRIPMIQLAHFIQ